MRENHRFVFSSLHLLKESIEQVVSYLKEPRRVVMYAEGPDVAWTAILGNILIWKLQGTCNLASLVHERSCSKKPFTYEPLCILVDF